MKKLLLLAAVLLISTAGSSAPPPAAGLSLDNLSSLVFSGAEPPHSIEETLPLLPESLRSRYVLMTDSRSLQEGTPENPRVIMFDKAGGIFATFNGGPGRNKRGGETLEAIQYDATNGRYNFATFVFSKNLGPLAHETPFKKNAYVTEFRNPKLCLTCHGSPSPRPNWEPYPIWPGAVPRSFGISNNDLRYLRDFSLKGAHHPRYQFLLRDKNIELMTETLPPATPDGKPFSVVSSMADQLNAAIEPQRQARLLERLQGTENFAAFRFAFMGAMVLCPDLEEFLPAPLARQFNAYKTRAAFQKETLEAVLKQAPFHQLFNYGTQNAEVIANLRWLLEPRGFRMNFWSTSFQSEYLFTTTPDSFYPGLVLEMGRFEKMNVPYQSLLAALSGPLVRAAVFTPAAQALHRQFCIELKARSVSQGRSMSSALRE